MDPQELRVRIIDLADRAGLLVVDEDENRLIKADTCWVDGRARCPYGQPEGQYILRPESFCHQQWARGDGCLVYHDNIKDDDLPESLKSQAVRDHFEQEKTTVVGELEARAEEMPEHSPERLAVELAATILHTNKLDHNILLEDDLPKE